MPVADGRIDELNALSAHGITKRRIEALESWK
jgi:hypothetical protein